MDNFQDDLPSHISNDENERVPELLPSLSGQVISVAGVVERIIEEFHIEHGDRESDAVKATQTEGERRALVRDVAMYVFAMESLRLSPTQQARIIGQAYSEIFSYGPLDRLFENETIHTIHLEGTGKLAVRTLPGGELQTYEPIFDDTHHLQMTLTRLLGDANAALDLDTPIVETGLEIAKRRVRVSIALPPFAPTISADIRLHPSTPLTLAELANQEFMTQEAYKLVLAIAQSMHGFVIVGDVESGKTTLASAMLSLLPEPKQVLSVERAGELALPDMAQRFVVQWKTKEQEERSFGESIQQAIEQAPKTLILDEIRSDEPQAIAPLLNEATATTRQIWLFRGSNSLKRTQSALNMLARRTNPAQSEAMVLQMQQRLPFMIVVQRRKDRLQLTNILEWQRTEVASNYLSLVPLMELGTEGCERTGKHPQRSLNLPQSFWD